MSLSQNAGSSSASNRNAGSQQDTPTQNDSNHVVPRNEERTLRAPKAESNAASVTSNTNQACSHPQQPPASLSGNPIMERFLLVGGDNDANRLYANRAHHRPRALLGSSYMVMDMAGEDDESKTSVAAVKGDSEVGHDYEWIDKT